MSDFEKHISLIKEQEPGNPAPHLTAWQEGPNGFKRRKRANFVDEPAGVYAVVAEWANQGPIVMEVEGPGTSYDRALYHAEKLRGMNTVLRTCVVRLEYEAGNELLIKDLERMQR